MSAAAYECMRRVTGKICNEIVVEVDRAQIEPRLSSLRENYRLMRDELLKRLLKKGEPVPKPLACDKVAVAKSMLMLDLAILQAEAAAGMNNKTVEVLAGEIHYEPCRLKCVLLS